MIAMTVLPSQHLRSSPEHLHENRSAGVDFPGAGSGRLPRIVQLRWAGFRKLVRERNC